MQEKRFHYKKIPFYNKGLGRSRSQTSLASRPKSSLRNASNFPKVLNRSFITEEIQQKKKNSDNSFIVSSKLDFSQMNKDKLYEETLRLKAKINDLKNQISFVKSLNRQTESEIIKKEKIIEIARSEARETNLEYVKDQAKISKIKSSFQLLKSRIILEKREKEELISEIKKKEFLKLEYDNNETMSKILSVVQDFCKTNEENKKKELGINQMKNNLKSFSQKHKIIKDLQNELEKKKNENSLLRQQINKAKDGTLENENYIKKKKIENNHLSKRNEKLLFEKKKHESYIINQPVYVKKIEEMREKVENYQKVCCANNDLIKKAQLKIKKIKDDIKRKNSNKVEEMDYKKLKKIEKDPRFNTDPKILLLSSLIRESKTKQKEYQEIISHYDDYILQKQAFEEIKEEVKELENENQTEQKDKEEKVNNEKEDESTKYLDHKNSHQAEPSIIENTPKNIIEKPYSFGESPTDEDFKEFKFLLLILYSINLTDTAEVLSKISELKNDDNFVIEVTKIILSQVSLNNQNDFITAQKYFDKKFLKKANNQKDKFLEKMKRFFGKVHLYTTEEENEMLEKVKIIYLTHFDSIMSKIGSKEFISIKTFTNILREENLPFEGDAYNFLIYKMKYFSQDNYSIFDLSVQEFIDMNKIKEENPPGSSDSSVQISDKKFKAIIKNFLTKLSRTLKEKKISLMDLIKDDVQKLEEGNSVFEVIDVYRFFEILKDAGMIIDDEIAKGCIFYQFQISEDKGFMNVEQIKTELEMFK